MPDREDDLLRRIRLGENSSLELKAVSFSGDRVSEPRREDLADEIAALANTRDVAHPELVSRPLGRSCPVIRSGCPG